jgi:hypothetical protein
MPLLPAAQRTKSLRPLNKLQCTSKTVNETIWNHNVFVITSLARTNTVETNNTVQVEVPFENLVARSGCRILSYMWVHDRPASLVLRGLDRKERVSHGMNWNGDPMKLTPWYLAAIAPLAVAGCAGAFLGHFAVIAVAIGIFVGTLSLGKSSPDAAKLAHVTETKV